MSGELIPDAMQRVELLANAGKLLEAEEAARSIQDRVIAAEAWRLLCRVNANTQRFEAARGAIENAMQLMPGSADIALERAVLLGAEGSAEESLAEFQRLEPAFGDSPPFQVQLGRAFEFAGRPEEAEARVEAALDRWPTDAALHTLLAELRWRRGAGEALTARLERAMETHPHDLKLRLVAADALRNAGFPERALTVLEEGLRRVPESPAFLTSVGVLIDALDRPADALPYLQAAVARAPGSIAARRNLVPTLLRLADAGAALRVCDDLLAQSPDDQQLIAWRATALRVTGDAEYFRLHDYANLVRSYRPRPAGPGGIAEFNAAFARELTALYRSNRRPLAQSLRGGAQTERNLPARNPLVAQFFELIDEPIRDYISRLDALDSGHPTARRGHSTAGAEARYRISGSWSVQLQPGGYHLNHVHPAGWLSSAYYLDLPTPDGSQPRAGWLAFGEASLGLEGFGPDHFVRPEPGMLVLFPSYMWHGTVPFVEGGRRLTAAFDVVPG